MKALKIVLATVPLLAVAILLLVAPPPGHSYVPTLCSLSGGGPCVSGEITAVHWSITSFPIQYNINPTTTTAHISGARTGGVGQVIVDAFATWLASPNIILTPGNVTRGPDSAVSSESLSPSNISLVCFVCTDTTFSDVNTLAVTLFTFSTAAGQSDGHGGTTQFPGQMIKADILFNPAASFTIDPAPNTANGSTLFDLQTVATHEIGHFFGLDHSAVVNAVMFPFSPAVRQTLAYDDAAGISHLYPGPQGVVVGSISGAISLNGSPVFGAHVFADSTTSANPYSGGAACAPVSSTHCVRKGPIGTLTDPSGNYTITGLPADSYTVTAEPLDGPMTTADVADYPKAFVGAPAIQTTFTTRQH